MDIILYEWRQIIIKNKRQMMKSVSSLLYLQIPSSPPKRFDLVKYSTWRMRLYQELESVSKEDLAKKKLVTLNQIFPKLCSTQQQKQFFQDFLMQSSNTQEQQIISYLVCRMLYSRDIKNQQVFLRVQRTILNMKLERITSDIQRMKIIKGIVCQITKIPLSDLNIPRQQYLKYQDRLLRWYDSKKQHNQHMYMKIPFELGQVGLKKRKNFVYKGIIYTDVETAVDIALNLVTNFNKQILGKIRNKTEKLLERDIQNQLKPFMDKAINSINSTTIDESELNSQFKLNLKNIDSVAKKYFPPCMFHLNQKLKENSHLKHDGRRQLWLFFKGCGMNVNDNKEYFRKHMQLKISNSDLKSHMYNIEHAYGLVGKKQEERPKMCRAIITGADPKKDQHHGCPFKHWGADKLEDYILQNYGTNKEQVKQIIQLKKDNYFQVACGRLFEANNKPKQGELPEQITKQLGKSPHQFFIAGMTTAEWINNKTLRPMTAKDTKNPQNSKMELEF